MAHLKQLPHTVNGLSLTTWGCSSVGYLLFRGTTHLPPDSVRRGRCSPKVQLDVPEALHHAEEMVLKNQLAPGGSRAHGLRIKELNATIKQQQQQNGGQNKVRPAKKKTSPAQEVSSQSGTSGQLTPSPSTSVPAISSSRAPMSIWIPNSVSPLSDPLSTSSSCIQRPYRVTHTQASDTVKDMLLSVLLWGHGPWILFDPCTSPTSWTRDTQTHRYQCSHQPSQPGCRISSLCFNSTTDCLDYKDQTASRKLNFKADCLDSKDQASSWKFQEFQKISSHLYSLAHAPPFAHDEQLHTQRPKPNASLPRTCPGCINDTLPEQPAPEASPGTPPTQHRMICFLLPANPETFSAEHPYIRNSSLLIFQSSLISVRLKWSISMVTDLPTIKAQRCHRHTDSR
ncbi:hypothetical protein GH733_013509, partial [Mirounga leonina]